MKRSDNHTVQGLLYFPAPNHNAPRLAELVSRHMKNGTAFTTQKKKIGLVFSGIARPVKGQPWSKLFLSKKPVPVKKYMLSDKKEDERFYPAEMSDSVKVRMLAMEFRQELPSMVRGLTDYCNTIIDHAGTLKAVWPARYFQKFRKWVNLVKRIYAKISSHTEMVSDPTAFAGLLTRGKTKLVIIDFLLRYKPRYRSRQFSRLVQQFFL